MKKSIYFLLAAALLMLPVTPAMAQGPQTAQQQLISLIGHTLVDALTNASRDVRHAREDWNRVRRNGTPEEQHRAKRELEQAEDHYRNAQTKVDDARYDAYAKRSGKSRDEIKRMRKSGMGWDDIAEKSGMNQHKGNNQQHNQAQKNNHPSQGNGHDKDNHNSNQKRPDQNRPQ